MAPTLKYSGSAMFRQRIVASLLSMIPLKIDKIRVDDELHPGLQDFEANFLQLVEKITDGSHIEINETGTTLRFRPGILLGSAAQITHDCGVSRSLGWFIEALLPLAPFCKQPLQLRLLGLTHDELDLSIDTLRSVTLPLLQNFGLFNVSLQVKKRGVAPKGGGEVLLSIPCVRGSMTSVYLVEEGLVKRVRGVCFATRVSPTIVTRVIDSCRKVLNDFLPDVHINSDHFKGGREGGDSPGYSLSLVAETTSGVLISVERTAKMRRANPIPGTEDADQQQQHQVGGESPETIGEEAAEMLLKEIFSGGVIDSTHQSLILQMMVLTPEDVSKVRFGSITPQAIETLRILKDAFGVVFRIREDRQAMSVIKSSKKSRRSVDVDDDNDNEEYGELIDLEEPKNEENDDGDNSDSNGNNSEIEEGDSDDQDDDDEEGDDDDNEDAEEDSDDQADDNEDSDDNVSDGESESEDDSAAEEEQGIHRIERTTYLLSCMGTGYTNVNRRVT